MHNNIMSSCIDFIKKTKIVSQTNKQTITINHILILEWIDGMDIIVVTTLQLIID